MSFHDEPTIKLHIVNNAPLCKDEKGHLWRQADIQGTGPQLVIIEYCHWCETIRRTHKNVTLPRTQEFIESLVDYITPVADWWTS